MLKTEELKKKIAEDYFLNKGNMPIYLKHFLGGEYEINLSGLKYNDMKSILEKEGTVELVSTNGKTANVTIDRFLNIDFYDNCQESKTLYASMIVSFYWTGIGEGFSIVEFNYDGSAMRSNISANQQHTQTFPNGRKSTEITYYILNIKTDYYDSDDVNYFDIEDRNIDVFSSFNDLEDMYFEPKYSYSTEEESSEKYDGETVISKLLLVKDQINADINNENNASIIKQLLKGE